MSEPDQTGRTPDDEHQYMQLSLLIWRDGEEGVEHPHLLTATVSPAIIHTIGELKAAIAVGVRQLLSWNSDALRVYWDDGEELSLMSLNDNDLLHKLVGCSPPGLWSLTIEQLTPAAIDPMGNLAEGLSVQPLPTTEETSVE